MVGLFNSQNFLVYRGEDSVELSKKAGISCSRIDYGRQILQYPEKAGEYMDEIISSFGRPSFIIAGACDGPVDCWVISSYYMNDIIYIEYWKNTYPERIYIYVNTVSIITSSFLKCLYESVAEK